MKAPIDWLKDYVDINVSTKELADAMTMSGSKVEGIEVQGEEITKVVVGKILSLEKHPDADRLQVATERKCHSSRRKENKELGLTRDDCPDAPEDGIYILPKEEELGKDIKEVLGLNKEIIV